MSRQIPEWIGTHDDQKIPDRVRERVSLRYNDHCIICVRKVGGALRAELDHITPLILGGQHRESNLRLVCHECHKVKTAFDMKLKAKVARVRKKHLGITKPKSKIQSRGFAKADPQRTASRPIQRRSEARLCE